MAKLEQLYVGHPKRPALVFIHGLQLTQGNVIETWRHESAPADYCWPHWLGEETNCDTWILEYDAALSAWNEQAMPLPAQGDQVASLLMAKSELEGRQLILLGHSMGGLVIKYLLVNAATKDDPRLKPLVTHTCGIVFIATPHAGAHLANLAEAVSLLLRTNRPVANLKAHDPHLKQVHDQFKNVLTKQKLPVLAFIEQHAVKVPILWGLMRIGKLVVNPTSADPGLAGVVVTPLGKDHFAISKPKDRTEQIHEELVKFVKGLAGAAGASGPLAGMRYTSHFYVERIWESDVASLLSSGNSVTVYGSERFGKSWFVNRIVELRPDLNWITLNFSDCPTTDFSKYLKCIAHQLCNSLDRRRQGKPAGLSIDEIWKKRNGPQAKLEAVLKHYDEKLIQNTVLLCDDIDAILPSEGKKTALKDDIANPLLRMMQAWLQMSSMPRFLFTISTTAARINAVLGNSSPFSRTTEKNLEDLGIPELNDLATMYGLNVSKGDMEALFEWIGGHPFLAGIAFDRVKRKLGSLDQVRPDWFIQYTERLTRHLNGVEALKGAMQQVCRGQNCVDNEDLAHQLRRIGLIVGEQGSLAPRNKLYKSLWSNR